MRRAGLEKGGLEGLKFRLELPEKGMRDVGFHPQAASLCELAAEGTAAGGGVRTRHGYARRSLAMRSLPRPSHWVERRRVERERRRVGRRRATNRATRT